jgi:GTP-binding nuclear protein Ran
VKQDHTTCVISASHRIRMSNNKLYTFKVVIVGNGASGKTTMVKRLHTGEFGKNYEPTLGVEVHPHRFCVVSKNSGVVSNICMNLWDTAGCEEYRGLGDGYYLEANGAIVCCSSTQERNERICDAKTWIRSVRDVCSMIPIVLVSTKVDECGSHPITSLELGKAHLYMPHILHSSRTCYGLDEPLLVLAKTLLNDDSLYIGESPAMKPPEVTLSAETMRIYAQQLKREQELSTLLHHN